MIIYNMNKFVKISTNEDIIKIAKLRQIFITEKGKIGLYWLNKNFDNVLTSDIQSLEENMKDKNLIF